MTVDEQFNLLQEKLQTLLRQQGRLQRENEQLRQELDAARQKEQQAQLQVDGLQQQVMILKVSSGELNEKDRKEFEKKIGQYIREIDKCIAYLSM